MQRSSSCTIATPSGELVDSTCDDDLAERDQSSRTPRLLDVIGKLPSCSPMLPGDHQRRLYAGHCTPKKDHRETPREWTQSYLSKRTAPKGEMVRIPTWEISFWSVTEVVLRRIGRFLTDPRRYMASINDVTCFWWIPVGSTDWRVHNHPR